MNIKVLGSGCRNCEALLKATQEAVAQQGVNAEIEYVTDMERVLSYGVMSMPALVIDEKVISSGKVLKAKDIARLL